MKHSDGTPVKQAEEFVPSNLLHFTLSLEATTTTEGVWQLMLDFVQSLGLTTLDYVYASDFENWERAQFIRTTASSAWFEYLKQFPHMRKTSNFRTHGVKYLTPFLVGPEFLQYLGDVSEEKRQHVQISAAEGLEAGIAIPLRSGDVGQAALVCVGGRLSHDAFLDIWNTHGWAIHVAMLTAHLRYAELFKQEFIQRNEVTEKQKELIRLVAQGQMDKQIAHELGISFSAVRQRLLSLQNKIGVQNRTDLVAVASRLGLVPDPLLKEHGDALTVFLATSDGQKGTEMAAQDGQVRVQQDPDE